MTRAEQERLVGRYLGGELSADEEQDFFIRVAVDNDLRQTLKAFRVVDSAIQKHRENSHLQHSDSRNRLVGMLSLYTGGEQPAIHQVSSAARSQARSGLRMRDASSSPLFFKWMMAAATACSLAVGTFVIAPFLGSSSESVPPTAETRSAVNTASRSQTEPIPQVSTSKDAEQTLVKDSPAPHSTIETTALRQERSSATADQAQSRNRVSTPSSHARIADTRRSSTPPNAPVTPNEIGLRREPSETMDVEQPTSISRPVQPVYPSRDTFTVRVRFGQIKQP